MMCQLECAGRTRTIFDNWSLLITFTIGIFCCLISPTTSDTQSSYISSLTSNSAQFVRPEARSGVFYYQAIRVTIYTNGKYTFRSHSDLDTYGYFYSGSFDPSNSSQNLIASDDDSGGNRQFQLNVTLAYGISYTLVVTTYIPGIRGDYSVTVIGPSIITFDPIPVPTLAPSSTTSSSFVSSFYYGELTTTGANYIRPGLTVGPFYYQAIRLSIFVSGTYIFRSNSSLDTYGYLYYDSFNPSNPSLNLIVSDDDSGGNLQFMLNATLAYGRSYILVVTTYSKNVTGFYSVTSIGPYSVDFHSYTPTTYIPITTTSSSLVPSVYSSSLSLNSGTFLRPGQSSGIYYYEAIRVTNYANGKYTFKSSSSVDTYGYFYLISFDPLNPSRNLMTSDDDSGGSGQFLLNTTLTYGSSYILVVTTYTPSITGAYSVTALGPSTITFDPIPGPTTTSTTITTTALIPSYYPSALTQNSPLFIRPGQLLRSFYYESILITAYSNGDFTLRSSSNLDTYGYLYVDSFDPLNPTQNLIAFDDDSGGDRQFLLSVEYTYGDIYILVVTTYGPSITGNYGVAALGPSTVYFIPYQPTTTSPTTTTSTPLISSSYSITLLANSGTYMRPGQTSDSYFYQAIRVTVYTSGKYTFKSSSDLDTYGYLYSGSFDPSNPSQNLIASDDDSGGNRQFQLNITLTYGGSYILVVTTYSPDVLGDITVHSLGPAIVSWTSITPTLFSQFGLPQIAAVIVGCIIILGIILSTCAYRRTRQRIINRTAVYSTQNGKAQLGQMPYVISIGSNYGSSIEKPSLSNN